MKKLLLYIALGLMCFSAPAQNKDLVIIHMNDTHSHLEPERKGELRGRGGVVERAAYIDSVRNVAGKKNVLLLHAGDWNQGTSYYTKFKGYLEVELLNAMKYDAISLGNHEFDNGLEDLAARLKKIKAPVLCANYDFTGTPLEKEVKPYTIVHRAGKKIGIFSVITDLSRVVDSEIAKTMKKMDYISVSNKWARYLKEKKHCDIVIALTHIGYDNDRMSSDVLLAGQTRNVDMIVGGHSHTFLERITYISNLDGKKVPIVQNGCWGLNYAELRVSE